MLALVAAAAFAVETKPLELGYLENPPYTFTNQFGKADGSIIELAHRALERTGLRWESVSYPAARLFHRLNSGETQLYFGLESPLFAASVIRSEQAVAVFRRRVYSLNPVPDKLERSWLEKKTIILLRANIDNVYERELREHMPGSIFIAENHKSGFEMLRRGRGDILLGYRENSRKAHSEGSVERLYWKDLENIQCYLFVSEKIPSSEELLKNIVNEYLRDQHEIKP